jgi:PleD family two-component response regulator
MLGDGDGHAPHIVLAHRDEWVSRSLEAVLAPSGYHVSQVRTSAQLLALTHRAAPDGLIIDFHLRDIAGPALCQQLRSYGGVGPQVPIILTSASPVGRADRVAAYSAGAWEVCTHPLDCELLLLQLRQFLGASSVVSTMRADSLVDETTGFYTMRGLARRARELEALARRCQYLLACVALTLEPEDAQMSDDMHSEVVAEAERQLVSVWRDTARSCDVIGRLQASEFAIFAPSTDEAGAQRMVERLRGRFDDSPVRTEGGAYRVRLRAECASVGNSGSAPVDAMGLLFHASQALHRPH